MHIKLRELLGYWNWLKRGRLLPERRDFSPSVLKHLLCDMFILTMDVPSNPRFRIAGINVSTIFNREVKGAAFSDLWPQAQHPSLQHTWNAMISETRPHLVRLIATNRLGQEAELEMLLLPLAHHGQPDKRLLGSIVSANRPKWMGHVPVESLRVVVMTPLLPHADAPASATPEPARPTMRRYKHLRVFDGMTPSNQPVN